MSKEKKIDLKKSKSIWNKPVKMNLKLLKGITNIVKDIGLKNTIKYQQMLGH